MSKNSAPKITTTVLIVFPERGGTNDIVLFDSNGDVIQEKQRTYACNTARWVAQHMPIDEHLLCNAIKHHRRGGECDGVIITSQGEVKPYHKPVNADRCTTNT